MHEKTLVFSAMLTVLLLLVGCGHNAIQYGDGVGFDVGINPENYTLSMTMRYGKILSAVTRDNVEIELTGNASADGEPGTAGKAGVKTDGNLKVKIGRQINGATADLVKAGADPNKVLEILKNNNKKTPAGKKGGKPAGVRRGI